ncbi:MAG: preprotein translocase subunit YajC [Myxococcota bacterium]
MSASAGVGLLQAAPEPSIFSMLFPMAAIFGIFYFLLIRPQQKRQREQESMIKAIEKGDSVVTAGGLHGQVTGVTDDVLTVEVGSVKGERVRVKIARARIDSVQRAKASETT